jgi:hypothetical protein
MTKGLKLQDKNVYCLRCNTELNIASPISKDIKFYQCLQCDSHYTLHKNKSLTDRWGMPIALILYGVIFEKKPVQQARNIAQQFSVRDDIDLVFLIKNVEDELQKPTQKVSEILDFSYPDEIALRSFLNIFSEELSNLIR